MKRYIFTAAVIFCYVSVISAQSTQTIEKWNLHKSTHFFIYYKNAQEDFIIQTSQNAEDYYNRIADDLGFRRYEFWLWDDRAKIYIYDDLQDYQKSTGQPAWSAGCADPVHKTIKTFPYAKGFFETILPHEMGHIIFREFVGFSNQAVPSWLEEGVASYQEKARSQTAAGIIRDALKVNKFMDLEKLSKLSPYLMRDINSINLFYAESVSIVEYLVKEFGQDNFVALCQNLRDKKDFTKALASSYPFSNIQELDKAWQAYLNRH